MAIHLPAGAAHLGSAEEQQQCPADNRCCGLTHEATRLSLPGQAARLLGLLPSSDLRQSAGRAGSQELPEGSGLIPQFGVQFYTIFY